MSCRKCGYRFLWQLETGANRCPKCSSLRKWSEELENASKRERERKGKVIEKDAVDLRKEYNTKKIEKTISKSDHELGDPRIYKQSTSYRDLDVIPVTSLGWRPYSKLETYQVSSHCPIQYFDRTYSRSYARPYSNPYNVPEEPLQFSYPTSHSSRNRQQNFNTTYSGRVPMGREQRDYKALIQPSYQVKSLNRNVIRAKDQT